MPEFMINYVLPTDGPGPPRVLTTTADNRRRALITLAEEIPSAQVTSVWMDLDTAHTAVWEPAPTPETLTDCHGPGPGILYWDNDGVEVRLDLGDLPELDPRTVAIVRALVEVVQQRVYGELRPLTHPQTAAAQDPFAGVQR
jgi:hypothetical protein